MSIAKLSPFFLFLIICLPSLAQLSPSYSFQQDDTALKKIYYQQTQDKKKSALGNIDKQYATDYKKIYEAQFKEIGDLWQSSKVVTAPAANEYLQQIVRKIVAANPQLAATDARIVFSRDWWPNAYSMGDGSIALNAGLFIFLDNEAEMVFILCHELAHYYLDHTGKAIRQYVETVNSPAYQAELKRLSKEKYRVNEQLEKLSKNFVFSSRRHKRENEAAADRLAFGFMKNTGYNLEGIRSCLQLLDKVDDSLVLTSPILERVFNFPDYAFRKKWIEQESAIFSSLNEEDSPLTKKEKDSLKTHPDCDIRIKMLADSLSAAGNNGSFFLVNENTFRSLRKDFLVEMAEQCYRDNLLSRHLYYNLQLLQVPEYQPMAIFAITRCLNLLYEKQQAHTIGLAVDTEVKQYPEDYNLLLRLLNRLRLDELASLNYNFCHWNGTIMKGYPGFEAEMKKAALRRK